MQDPFDLTNCTPVHVLEWACWAHSWINKASSAAAACRRLVGALQHWHPISDTPPAGMQGGRPQHLLLRKVERLQLGQPGQGEVQPVLLLVDEHHARGPAHERALRRQDADCGSETQAASVRANWCGNTYNPLVSPAKAEYTCEGMVKMP